jgi:hypothetical protein
LTTAIEAGAVILVLGELRVTSLVLTSMREIMPEFQPVASAHVAAIQRPACPNCQHNRMLLSKLGAGAAGAERGTFECQRCGRVQSMLLPRSPMTSVTRRWLASELRPLT